MDSNSPTTKRMSISLPSNVVKKLEFLAQAQGISQAEVIRKAILQEDYFFSERKAGSKVLVQRANQKIREVVFLDW